MEIMSKELKASLRTVSHQIKNINDEIEMIVKRQKETAAEKYSK